METGLGVGGGGRGGWGGGFKKSFEKLPWKNLEKGSRSKKKKERGIL